MGTATAQCPAAPKPQQYPPPPMPRPGTEHPPPAVLTVAELEAAVAALPGKRDALREAFDRLAACSPTPLPFAWEDLDAHLSSLQWSISLRFLQLRALEAARATPTTAAPGETRDGGMGVNLEEEEVVEVEERIVAQDEEVVVAEAEERIVAQEEEEEEKADDDMREGDDEMQEGDVDEAADKIDKGGKDEEEARDEVLVEQEVVEAADDKIGNEIKDEKDAREEMQVANEEKQSTENSKKASQDKEEEQSMKDAKKPSLDKEEQDTNMEEAATKKASALQGKEQEACGEKQVEEEEQESQEEKNAKNITKEVEKKASQPHAGPVEFNDLAAAFASMDARWLVKLIHTNTGLSTEFRAAMHHAPDGAALSLRVVELFLHDKTLKTNKVWGNCVGLIRTVPEVVTKLSTESIEHAKRLAKDWKEMIDNLGSWMALGNRASWGLLYFLISYNIVSEFDTKEIFHIFGTIPRKQQKKNHSVLFKGLGLADRIPELMDYLIGNGQQMNVLYLAPFFNLVDKYPPLSLLKGYVEKAKQTVVEVSQKNMTRQSLVIINELDNLRMARELANRQITDSGVRTSIIAEINVLLGEFGRKKRNLADASAAITSNAQQQQTESKKKRKKEQEPEHRKGQENQQKRQQSKPGVKLEKKQNEPQQEQQPKKQNKPQQEQQRKKQNKPQQEQQQNEHQHSNRRRRTPKLPARASPMVQNVPVPQRGHSVHPPFAATHGIHHGYPVQPGWPGVHCAAPPAPQLGGPEYVGPSNPLYSHPQFYTQ